MAHTSQPTVFEFDRFKLDLQQQRLLQADGSPITLPSRAFELLAYLVEHAGELIEKPTLMKAVWPNVVVEENNLSQQLSTLRRALGDGQDGRRYIITVPGRGYRFVAEVSSSPASAADTSSAPAVSASPEASVAVLPFANLSGDSEIEYFGDGMAEELIHLLTRVPGLKVPARTSSFVYKQRNLHVREIARDLGVRTVLEGSVRSAGERIRITAQLVSAETGYHLWSESFDRQFGDIFRLQDEIAAAIVRSLRAQLGATLDAPAAPTPPTRDMEAYQLYLQGMSIGQRAGLEELMRGIEFLERAIARDPQFARAYAAMAALRIALIFYGRPETVERARREAEKALALDSSLDNAYSVLGIASVIRGEWLQADAHFHALRSGDPTKDPTLPGYLYVLYLSASAGHVRKALQTLWKEYEANPALPVVLAVLGAAQLALPLREEATLKALHFAELATELGAPPNAGPMPATFSYVALRLARKEDAARAAELYVTRLSPPLRESGTAEVIRQVHRHLGDPAGTPSALPALVRLVESVKPEHVGPEFGIHLMAWLTMMGALDVAYAFANRMLEFGKQRDTMGLFLNWLWIPELAPFRADARFGAIVERLNLMPYWLRYGPPDEYHLEDGRLVPN